MKHPCYEHCATTIVDKFRESMPPELTWHGVVIRCGPPLISDGLNVGIVCPHGHTYIVRPSEEQIRNMDETPFPERS